MDWRKIEQVLVAISLATGIEIAEDTGEHFIYVAAHEGDEDLEIRLSDIAKELAERLA